VSALRVLHYWRDDAAHGMATVEVEAYASDAASPAGTVLFSPLDRFNSQGSFPSTRARWAWRVLLLKRIDGEHPYAATVVLDPRRQLSMFASKRSCGLQIMSGRRWEVWLPFPDDKSRTAEVDGYAGYLLAKTLSCGAASLANVEEAGRSKRGARPIRPTACGALRLRL
jgi:hypothetical protein